MMDTKRFSAELNFVSGTVEKKTTIPVLANILLTQDSKSCTLTGTDLEIAAVSAFKGDKNKIRTTVSAKALKDALKSLKDVADFEITNDSKGLSLGADGFSSTLSTLSPEPYPELPTLPEDGGVHIPFAALSAMLTCAKHALSVEESRFTLNGALLDITDGMMRVVATDGHRLCIVEHPYQTGGATLRFIVRRAIMEQLPKMVKVGTCRIFQNKDWQFFVASPAERVSRLLLQRMLTGNFPDYQRVLPAKFKLKATVDRAAFIRIASQILPMTDKDSRCAKLTLSNTLANSSLAIESTISDSGSAKASIGVAIDKASPLGSSVRIGFNLEYVLQALKAMNSDEVTLCLNAPDQAGEIDGTINGMAVREVIMPMRM